MIKTVIFDIGNVLIDFDWGEYIKELVAPELYPVIKGAMFSEFWNEIDRGVLTDEEMIAGFAERAGGYEKEIRLAYREVGRALAQRDYAVPWITELKQRGFKILYLSNYSHHVMRSNPDALSFIEHTDGGIFSCDVKLIKPDPEIYKALIHKYSLTPSECVFIDDNAANIAAANELGFNTIHFTGYDTARAELEGIIA